MLRTLDRWLSERLHHHQCHSEPRNPNDKNNKIEKTNNYPICVHLCPLKESVLYLGVCFFHSILCLVCNPFHPPFQKTITLPDLKTAHYITACAIKAFLQLLIHLKMTVENDSISEIREAKQEKLRQLQGMPTPAYLSTCSRYSKRWTCLVLILYNPKCPQDSWLIHF